MLKGFREWLEAWRMQGEVKRVLVEYPGIPRDYLRRLVGAHPDCPAFKRALEGCDYGLRGDGHE